MKKPLRKKKLPFPQTGESSNTKPIALCIILSIITFAVYWQVLGHEFLSYDDNKYVTKNWNVQAGLTSESIAWAFTTGHFANWHPVTWISHIIDFELFGLDPTGPHLINLLIHIANASILFLVFTRMTGAVWQSGFVAALFALHPFNVESVAWIAERKNVLSTFFWLLTMWSYIRFVEKPSTKKYVLTAIFFIAGLMAKPMLVTLPFVLLMLDFWPLKRWKPFSESTEGIDSGVKFPRLLQEKIPLFLFAVGISIVTYFVQKEGGALKAMAIHSFSTRISNALVSYASYLEKTFWPANLSVFYPHPGDTIPIWKASISLTILLSLSFVAIKWIKKAPYIAFGWFWFLGTLVPVIQIVQTGDHAMADRYAYISIIGLFIIVAWGLPDLLSRWNLKERAPVIFAGLLIPLVVVTWVQLGHWKNSITLFEHAISVTNKKYPDLSVMHNNLGIALEEKRRLSQAMKHYKVAMKINPDFPLPYNNLGNILFTAERTEEAIAYFKSALRLEPDYALAHSNLGIALEKKGDLEEAIFHYREAVRYKPDLVLAHYNLGIVFKEKGELEEAISHYKEAIKFRPNFALAHNNLANILLAKQETNEAIYHYKLAIENDPNLSLARNNLKIAIRRRAESN